MSSTLLLDFSRCISSSFMERHGIDVVAILKQFTNQTDLYLGSVSELLLWKGVSCSLNTNGFPYSQVDLALSSTETP